MQTQQRTRNRPRPRAVPDVGDVGAGGVADVPVADGNLREHELPDDVAGALRGEAAVQKAANFLLDPAQYAMPAQQRRRSAGQLRPDGVAGARTTGSRSCCPPIGVAGVQLPGRGGADRLRSGRAGHAARRQRARSPTARTRRSSRCRQFDVLRRRARASCRPGRSPASAALAGARPATVEVVAIVETPKVPANSYAAFATANTCGAIYFHGNVTIDSYDSSVARRTRRRQQHGGQRRRRRHERQPADPGQRRRAGQPVHAADRRRRLHGRRGHGVDARPAAPTSTGSIVQLPTAVTYPPPTFSRDAADDAGHHQRRRCSRVPALRAHRSGLTLGRQLHRQRGREDRHDRRRRRGRHDAERRRRRRLQAGLRGQHARRRHVNINSLTGSGDVEVDANMTPATRTNPSC